MNFHTTPLHIAVENGHMEVVDILLCQAGAGKRPPLHDCGTRLHDCGTHMHDLANQEGGLWINRKLPIQAAVSTGRDILVARKRF